MDGEGGGGSGALLVFGHRSPDTDTICSAIVLADLVKGTPARLGEMDPETELALRKFGAAAPILLSGSAEGKRVYLVDHNEAVQSAEGIEKAVIAGIVDHHKFGLRTAEPILIRAEPLGATASIIYKKFVEQGRSVTKQQAGLLLCAILSDTAIFRSPTTTQEDREIAEELVRIAGVKDIEALGLELKKAKADFAERDLAKAVSSDFKVFPMGSGTLGISEIEVTDDARAQAKAGEIVPILGKLKAEGGHHTAALMAANIAARASRLFVVSDSPGIVEAAFGKKLENGGSIYFPGVLSKKKDIIPKLERVFSAAKK